MFVSGFQRRNASREPIALALRIRLCWNPSKAAGPLLASQLHEDAMDWTGGYVADIGYTAHFYRETAASHMAFAALCIGRSPGHAFKPKRMLELGFGQGFGLTLLAAANPDIVFEGFDFNPEHVAHARRLAQGAGLANITLFETGFEEAAARGGDNDVDVIALHGIFSWVSRQAQDA